MLCARTCPGVLTDSALGRGGKYGEEEGLGSAEMLPPHHRPATVAARHVPLQAVPRLPWGFGVGVVILL